MHLPQNLPDWPLQLIANRFSASHHGDYTRWAAALAQLPAQTAPCPWQANDNITIELDSADPQAIEDCLQQFHPWRKGPFQLGSIFIDTEWRSDWKWQRLAPHIQVSGRVLDIGCGNGYFGWHMLAQGASEVVGVDPTLLFCMQHLAINHFIQSQQNWVLPLGIEDIPATTRFDWVFSMGVIYHRKDPVQHVQQLFALCAPGGGAVLESLVVQDQDNLIPAGRYARMRNVWCVPTPAQMVSWMQQAGFAEVEIVDISATTVAEQRSTDWMRFESLAQSLDPADPGLTIEGYPAPTRAVVIGYRR